LKKGGGSPDAEIAEAPGLNVLETEFIAGLMDHLQAVAAFTLPTMASYERLMDGAWAGGTYICWAVENRFNFLTFADNREAPVRACFSGNPRKHNFEIKCLDGTANPYLALSAILAAGLLGVKSSSPLKMKACQGT
jgi:glutamine synthetase